MCTKPASVSTTRSTQVANRKPTICGGGPVDIYIAFKTHTHTVEFEIINHKCAHDAKRLPLSGGTTTKVVHTATMCNVHETAPNGETEEKKTRTDQRCAN